MSSQPVVSAQPVAVGQPVGHWRVLSCYTANLAGYLEAFSTRERVADRIARSARLAVRTDLPDGIGFSHHAEPLDRVDEEHRLVYRGSDDPRSALAGMRAELAASGRLLVLTHSAAMPWSVVRAEHDGPHFLLVDDRRAGEWHVLDHFAGLLPSGLGQDPHEGWVDDAELLGLMAGTGSFTPEQERRNSLVFGFPVPVAAGRWRWFELTGLAAGAGGAPGDLSGQWLHEPVQVWSFLADRLVEQTTAESAPGFLDDLWAASQHHRHRCEQLLGSGLVADETLRKAADAWERLPQSLRFAAESARRGRRRDSLVTTAVRSLAEQEQALTARLVDCGWRTRESTATGGSWS